MQYIVDMNVPFECVATWSLWDTGASYWITYCYLPFFGLFKIYILFDCVTQFVCVPPSVICRVLDYCDPLFLYGGIRVTSLCPYLEAIYACNVHWGWCVVWLVLCRRWHYCIEVDTVPFFRWRIYLDFFVWFVVKFLCFLHVFCLRYASSWRYESDVCVCPIVPLWCIMACIFKWKYSYI